MIQENRHDAILVRIISYEDDEEVFIASYYTTAIDQTLRMYLTAKENDISCFFNEMNKEIDEKYRYSEHMIDDVRIHFGANYSSYDGGDSSSIEVVII